MNFGRRGFPNVQETGKNGDSWFVATPEKQPVLVRSANPVPVERQVNQMGIGNWQELIGMYSNILNHDGSVQTSTPTSGVCGENTNKNGVVSERNLNASRNTGSSMQNLSNDNAGRDANNLAALLGIRNTEVVGSTNGTRNQRIMVSTRPANSNSNSHSYIQVASNRMEPEHSGLMLAQQNYNFGSSHRFANSSSYSQVESNWLAPESTCLMPEKQNFTIGSNQRLANFNTYNQVADNRKESESTGLILTKQDRTLDSNQRLHHSSLTQLPDDGFPVPYWPNYNLNSPPRPELDAALSISSSFNFAPVTPDQAKQLESQRVSERLNISLDETSSQEREEQWNVVTSINGEVENHANELSQIIADSASAVISTPLKEMNVLCNEGEQGIDLNKTPEQKTPRRRKKHRPKVVIEGKPKRAQKPATSKTNVSSDKPSGKRKYVRKKVLKTPESQQENVNESILPTVESSQKSCRRSLNFDLEAINRDASFVLTASHKSRRNEESNRPFNLNLNPDEAEMNTEINSISETSAGRIEQAWQKHSYSEKNQQIVSTCNLTCSTNQVSSEYRLLTEQITSAKPPAKAKDHTLNVIARNMNMRNSIPGQTSLTQGYNQMHQHNCGEEISHSGYDADSLSENFYRTRSSMLQNATQLAMSTAHEKRGFNRAHCHIVEQMQPHSQNLMGSPILSQENLYMGNPNSGRNNVGTIVSEAHQKMSSENILHANISSIPSSTKAVTHLPKEDETGGVCFMYANNVTSQINDRLLNSWYGRDNSSNKNASSSVVNETSGDWSIVPMATKPNFECQQASLLMAERVHQLKAPKIDCQQGNTSCDSKISTNKKPLKPVLLNQSSRRAEKVLQQQKKDALEGSKQSLLKARGASLCNAKALSTATGKLRKQQLPVSVDEITNLLEGLHISGRNDVAQEKHALVPYKGSGTIVPYEGFDPIKKRKPRPKVDLDPETDRIWKLLMGSEGNESTETADKDKAKWWEEERKMFRGRADSFIARMHLVQGDRRFSRWKGSVVDSVIGVFLTQNVSDHLSSSAFMSLAAKFPLQSDQNGTCVIFENPSVQVVESNGSIYTLFSGTKSTDRNHNDGILTAAFNTPQHSFDSLGFRTSEEIITTSRSSSREGDRISGLNLDMNYNSSENMFQMEKTVPTDLYSLVNKSSLLDERPTPLHQQLEKPRSGRFNNLGGCSLFPSSISSHILHTPEPNLSSRDFQLHVTPESELQNKCYFELPGDKHISSFAQAHSGITSVQSVNHMTRWIGNTFESNTLVQRNGVPSVETPTLGPFAFLGEHPTQNLQPQLLTGCNHHSTNNHKLEMNKMLHLERTNATKPVGSPATSETGSVSGQDKPKCLDNITEANKKEEGSLKPLDGTGTNVQHSKKGKVQGEKNTFDWDSLRKTAQSNGKRERSKEAMDSLDYEALRCADISEISNAIKERGMNNMLAERIKDFLNRLVTDHGSVDLEWLRDVPPDKAKDYLLSIRGLGLKSVECVRLLTLHQLAFPVDTNVGRIAVRLGWVPLQPLPESLQLHLLELYPILESIQKFLWPRLCNLDQQTLYELHYQMITFGKVFCTKSKPNCNACPMRGECRHFASAFASARLALPGPEEKRIVTYAVPIANDSTPMTPIKPILLLQTDQDASIEAGLIDRRCEPIVEEPASPELEITELLERDIEDACYEDPGEIPTIKLNIEEFTLNLQNYMQDNMELQEGDMSRALIALDPEAALIPTPKLKNVSRLRTEHQVYELPDSHPLLKGLDKREPDDPSPYLLAIWTPGETATSIQPPESRCEIHEAGQLCNDTTCFSCNNTREANSQTVRGTILIPCRTATRGSFPLNGTYFQVNEMFADHESSLNPIDVPRSLIWNLPRRTVYFGTSVTSIFKGLPTEGIQFCFWKGFVCVRGFDKKRRAPRPLMARLHFPASKLVKPKK